MGGGGLGIVRDIRPLRWPGSQRRSVLHMIMNISPIFPLILPPEASFPSKPWIRAHTFHCLCNCRQNHRICKHNCRPCKTCRHRKWIKQESVRPPQEASLINLRPLAQFYIVPGGGGYLHCSHRPRSPSPLLPPRRKQPTLCGDPAV